MTQNDGACYVWCLCAVTFADGVTLPRPQTFRGRIVLVRDYWGSMRRTSRGETPLIFAARHPKFRETKASLFIGTGVFWQQNSLVAHTPMP